MKKFKIVTYGCQINEYESEKFREFLLKAGFEETDRERDADFVILNSCAVRKKSEQKLLSRVGYIRKLFYEQGKPVSVVTGCVATVKEKEIKRIGEKSVALVMKGTRSLKERIEKLREFLNIEFIEPSPQVKGVFAYVPIIFGCDNFCTYCIVPFTKGRERSRTKEEVLKEVRFLVEGGTKEIVLLGQNINHYGRDIGYKNGFVEILEEVNKMPGLKRLRYLTPHPADFTDEDLKRMRNLEKLCPHFHLPVQSGSDKILKLMKRGYTKGEYLSLIEKVKKLFPEASITTDIIVGFPQETEEDYEETKKLVEEVRFDKIFIAAYSPREGTVAAKMEGQIEEKVKKERLNELLKIEDEISLEKNRAFVGKETEVLVENVKESEAIGRNPQDKVVIIENPKSKKGDIVSVHIKDADKMHLRGIEE
ncbi:MAG: tRNA (N6-isopentenyl adenosine(37)-C2)-methylthiotransferase MiaB [Caldisericaceae bacterium]|nr:tRNA (N6-isopentenyl adenosine(37)-C2)-methylthiotransferase MiaB [Caldisericaceae bacterium]